MNPPAALALWGLDPSWWQLLRALCEEGGWPLVPVHLPDPEPASALLSLHQLGFAGALVGDDLAEAFYPHVGRTSPEARSVQATDTLSVPPGGYLGFSGHHTLATALVDAALEVRLALQGSKLLVLGGGARARAALALARLGVSAVILATPELPLGERAAATVPPGPRVRVLWEKDPLLPELALECDVVALAAAPGRDLLQPYHTLIDLSGQQLGGAALQRVDPSVWQSWRLKRQLEQLLGWQVDLMAIRRHWPTERAL